MFTVCEECGEQASYGEVEMVDRPAHGGNGSTAVLRHHSLCSLHSNKFPGAFLIAGAGLEQDGGVRG